MEINKILEQVNEIFKDELDDENINLNLETTANDVEEWDSLSHIHLMVAIEKFYNIHFNTKEIQSLKNIGELCNLVQQKAG